MKCFNERCPNIDKCIYAVHILASAFHKSARTVSSNPANPVYHYHSQILPAMWVFCVFIPIGYCLHSISSTTIYWVHILLLVRKIFIASVIYCIAIIGNNFHTFSTPVDRPTDTLIHRSMVWSVCGILNDWFWNSEKWKYYAYHAHYLLAWGSASPWSNSRKANESEN